MDKPDISCPEHPAFNVDCLDCTKRLALAYCIQRGNYNNLNGAHIRLEAYWHEVADERDKLKAALTISRAQWIHSVCRQQCLAALGEQDQNPCTVPEHDYCRRGGH